MNRILVFKTILFVVASHVIMSQTSAQNKQLSFSANEGNQIATLPYFAFQKGIGITSPDSFYQLNIRFRMQNRASFISNEDADPKIDAHIRRLRLRFDGFVGSPKLIYSIQLSFTPDDVGGPLKAGENLNIIRDAIIFYQPNKKWSIGFGQTKLPGNRQRINSSGALQLTDRSINNARFTIDRDFGVQIHQQNQYSDHFSYNFNAAITTGEGRNRTNSTDMGLAYTGKVGIYPFGVFKKNGDLFEGDVMREETPKLMLSAAYQYNDNAKRTQGQIGEELYRPLDLVSVFADAVLKYNGWAFMAAYMSRKNNNPITVNPNNPQEISYAYVGNGADFQGSYVFPNNFEIVGRVSLQQVAGSIERLAPDNKQFSVGLNKYIWQHAFKLQTELTYDIKDFYNGDRKQNWYARFQIEIGI